MSRVAQRTFNTYSARDIDVVSSRPDEHAISARQLRVPLSTFPLTTMFRISLVASLVLTCLLPVDAAHSVVMQNFCGTGVPTLDQVPSLVLNTGTSMYTNETIKAVAFLNTGVCGPNGGHCTVVDIELGTLSDGSSTALISLVPTNEFTVPVSFVYFNGCDGASQTCRETGCPNAANAGALTQGIVQCTAPGASLSIIFCPDSTMSSSSLAALSSSTSSSSPAARTDLSKSSTGAIAGGVVGGVLAAAILAGLGLLFWRKRRREDQWNPQNPIYDTGAQPRPYTISESQTTGAAEPKHGRESSTVAGSESMTSGTSSVRTRTVAPTVTSEASQPSLDHIIEGLANRFGWTRPSVAGEAPPKYGEPGFVGH
ncbi:hypothetical protein C8J56DRAFT_592294 [Mycena floridula]|nr:hypothetical protein C8J56DRAFT_592294 [Mycena floridula]